jgi:hypothetical protein
LDDVITTWEKDTLTTLVSQTALADGSTGKGDVRAWPQTHHMIDVSSIAQIPCTIRAQDFRPLA